MSIANRVHITKRTGASGGAQLASRLVAIVVALAASGLVMLFMGYHPLEIFGKIITSSLSTYSRFGETMNKTILLTMLSLGISVAFRMKFWNIGAEGQFYMGAFGAALIAFGFPDLPAWLLLPLMGLCAFVFGGIWALIPALIKAKFTTSETLVTLMMNYIATQLAAFFIIVWEVPKGAGKIGIINQGTEAGWLPVVGGQKYLLVILVVAVLTVFMYIYLNYSKHGYEIAVVGESQRTASYAGIKVERVIVRTMVLSGAVCGLMGLLLTAGTDHTLTTTIVGGRGFTAVMVSWMAKFNPIIMIFTSLLLVVLGRGASEISSTFGLNQSFSDILTGIILFFIIGSEFFITYQVSLRKSGKKEA